MTTQRPSTLEKRIEQLFPSKGPTAGASTALRRRFVRELAERGDQTEVVSAFEKFTNAAGARGIHRLANDEPAQAFAVQLAESLAVCWSAYRNEKEHRVLKGLSKGEFRGLPNKLDKLADALDLVNASLYGNPTRREAESLTRLSRTSFRFPEALDYSQEEVRSYSDLPRVMRAYADRLRGPYRDVKEREEEMLSPLNASGERVRALEVSPDSGLNSASLRQKPVLDDVEESARLVKAIHEVRQGDLARDAEVHLVNLIKQRTGEEHLVEAAQLLLAAYCLQAGRTWSEEEGEGLAELEARFDEHPLERRLARYRAERKRPAPFAHFHIDEIFACIAKDLARSSKSSRHARETGRKKSRL